MLVFHAPCIEVTCLFNILAPGGGGGLIIKWRITKILLRYNLLHSKENGSPLRVLILETKYLFLLCWWSIRFGFQLCSYWQTKKKKKYLEKYINPVCPKDLAAETYLVLQLWFFRKSTFNFYQWLEHLYEAMNTVRKNRIIFVAFTVKLMKSDLFSKDHVDLTYSQHYW